MRTKRVYLFMGLSLVLLLMSGCGGARTAHQSSSSEATAVPPVVSDSSFVVDGTLVPQHKVLLTAPTGGRIQDVLVVPGQHVSAGEILVQLDDAQARALLAEAHARLERAQAYLAKLQAGPRDEEISAAQTAVEIARARLAKVRRGPSAADVAAAKAEVAAAQAALQKLKQGPNPYELAAAQAELDNARVALQLAQSAYDRVKYAPDIGARPESLRLEQATNAYKVAEARLKALQQGVSKEEIAAAQARLEAAQARLETLKAGPTPEDVAIAQAQLHQAEAQLALAQSPARPEDIRLAKADVAIAESAVRQAEIALEQTRIKAPFAGIVGDIQVERGMFVSPGTPLMRLGDTNVWWVQTTNLSELDVVRVRVGDPVTLTFDALPDLEMKGKVVAIDPVGKNRSGDVLYTVYIQVDGNDARLHWGMTAAVHFTGKE